VTTVHQDPSGGLGFLGSRALNRFYADLPTIVDQQEVDCNGCQGWWREGAERPEVFLPVRLQHSLRVAADRGLGSCAPGRTGSQGLQGVVRLSTHGGSGISGGLQDIGSLGRTAGDGEPAGSCGMDDYTLLRFHVGGHAIGRSGKDRSRGNDGMVIKLNPFGVSPPENPLARALPLEPGGFADLGIRSSDLEGPRNRAVISDEDRMGQLGEF
jgi:hypothetical protein